jgi:hypothetical protein
MNPKFGTENFHNIINKVSSYYDYQSTLPLFNLFKLHGSLNWKYEKDTIYYDNKLAAVQELKKCNLAKVVECFDEEGKFYGFSKIYDAAKEKATAQEKTIKNSDPIK